MGFRKLINGVAVSIYLDEANVLGVAAEALPAAHQPVLADQAMRVAADTAATNKNPNHNASQTCHG